MADRVISKRQFLSVEKVRESGITNMYDLEAVSGLTGLEKDVIKQIYKEYEKLEEMYLEEK
jgi:hypothetical protein